MKETKVTDSISYIGVEDKDIDLFEGQYAVPEGITYNSYLIKDEKIVVMDTVDKRKQEEWFANLEKELNGKQVDYLVVSHLEPDHSACIQTLAIKYPAMKIIGNALTFKMLPQFCKMDVSNQQIVVKEGDSISIGTHTLEFLMAPMVHWPEVMLTYEETEKILFTADALGRFGSLDTKDWTEEARRYYINIVGKYGAQVQAALRKVANLEIQTICPLHGPVLKENLAFYLEKYNTWSSYLPEEDGVFIAYNSIYGNTQKAIQILEQMLKEAGVKNGIVMDLAREDQTEAVAKAFQYDKMVLACPTYDSGIFPPMEAFLNRLKSKNYQKRKVVIIENGSWAPVAAQKIKEHLEEMKEIEIVEPIVSIKTSMSKENEEEMKKLVLNLIQKGKEESK